MGIKFDYPKPYTLIEFLLSTVVKENSIILDSFAGSGTTGHAFFNLVKQGKKLKKVILIEMEDYADSVTANRIKHIISGYEGKKNKVEGTGGSFSFYELGERLLTEEGCLNESVPLDAIRAYIWHTETNASFANEADGNPYYLGKHNGAGYWFYYKKGEETTLDMDFVLTIRNPHSYEQFVIYADKCVLSEDYLKAHHVTFKQIPRDIHKL